MLQQSDPRFVKLHRRVGLFVLLALAGAAAVFYFKGAELGLFTRAEMVFLNAQSGKDIFSGQQVALRGFTIGKVHDVRLDEDATVKVILSIEQRYMHWLREDSRALLVREMPIGDGIIEVTPGSRLSPQLTDGGVIEFERGPVLTDLIHGVKSDVTPLIADLRHLLAESGGMPVQVNELLDSVGTTVAKLDQLLDHVEQTVLHADRLLASTGKMLGTMDVTAKKTAGLVNTISTDLPRILQKIEGSLDRVDAMTSDLKQVTEETAPEIPQLVQRTDQLLHDTQELVDALKTIWPISTRFDGRVKSTPREPLFIE